MTGSRPAGATEVENPHKTAIDIALQLQANNAAEAWTRTSACRRATLDSDDLLERSEG